MKAIMADSIVNAHTEIPAKDTVIEKITVITTEEKKEEHTEEENVIFVASATSSAVAVVK